MAVAQVSGQLNQGWCLLELIAPDRITNANQFLTDNPTCSDREVSNLGIAHLLIRQTHIGATGLNQRVGVRMPKGIHYWGFSVTNRVVGLFAAVSPPIKNGEHDGWRRCGTP